MAKFESQIKQVNASQSAVYDKISDLNNLAVIKERINDPMVQSQIPADKLEQVKDSVSKMEFTKNTVTAPAGPVGTISLKIIDREPEKCVKFTTTNSHLACTLWVQMLPTSETTSKIKVTLEAELNFFMKQMLEKPLKEGVDKLADMLAMIPY